MRHVRAVLVVVVAVVVVVFPQCRTTVEETGEGSVLPDARVLAQDGAVSPVADGAWRPDAARRDAARQPPRDAGRPDTAPVSPRDGGQAQRDAGHADGGPPDARSPADAAACVEVASPAPVSLESLPAASPPGRWESVTAGSFHDDYLYDGTDYIKVGTRREWGGSITFFGLAAAGPGLNPSNTIDANDTGREVQVAFYDPDRIMQGCAWNGSCVNTPTSCPNSITYLGWNPVQGGNRCNNGSPVDSTTGTGGVLTAVVNPLFWNPVWDRGDCDSSACGDVALAGRRSDVQVVQRLRFVRTHVVELDYTVSNLSDVDHAETFQEMPTLYSANGQQGPDLWRLVDSDGNDVPIDQPAGGDGFNYKNLTSPGGWVSLQDDGRTYGVGILYENRLSAFQGWQLRSMPFNNVRAQFPFGIPAHGTVRARAYLVLGAYATVAAEAAWLDTHLAPFGVLDSPSPDAEVSGLVDVWGWALDNKGVTAVDLVVNGRAPVPMTTGSERPDVCLVWPGYAGCPRVGYHGVWDTSALARCSHVVEVVAEDSDGNRRVIASRRVHVR